MSSRESTPSNSRPLTPNLIADCSESSALTLQSSQSAQPLGSTRTPQSARSSPVAPLVESSAEAETVSSETEPVSSLSTDSESTDGTTANPANATVEEPVAVLTTKRQLRKIIREDSKWSMSSIAITALTGVSVAVISTQLTGLVSSMVLIAIMAFISASVSELYRIFLGVTGLGAKKAAAQAAKVIPIPLAVDQLRVSASNAASSANRNEAASARASEEPVSSDSLETAADSSSSRGATDSADPITEAIQVIANPYRLSESQEATRPGRLRRIGYHLSNYSRANPFLLLVALFIGVAIATLATAYIATDGEPPQIVQRTVQVTQELSAADRAAIVAEAKQQALEEVQAQQPLPIAPLAPVQDPDLSELTGKISALESELDNMRLVQPTPSATSQPTPGGASVDTQLTTRVTQLEKERADLSKRVTELEAELAALPEPSTVAPLAPAVPTAPARANLTQ